MNAEFRRKNEAQFAKAKDGLQRFARLYVLEIADYLIERTPGFGNQFDGTQYIPTGRLRGGYNYTRSPIGATSKGYFSARGEAGPFSDYGRETLTRISGQLAGDRMGGFSYLENDVAYGHDIVTGAHNHAHIGPRNFPDDAATKTAQIAAFRRAQARMGAV